MKKATLILLLLTAIIPLSHAQYDTIQWGDTNYYWGHLPNPDTGYGLPHNSWVGSFWEDAFLQLYVDTPMTIYGLAGVSMPMQNIYFPEELDINFGQFIQHGRCKYVVVKVYQQHENRGEQELLDSAANPTDSVQFIRSDTKILLYDYLGPMEYYGQGGVPRPSRGWLVPFYFTHPVVVHDTFYVSIRAIHRETGEHTFFSTYFYHLRVPCDHCTMAGNLDDANAHPSQWSFYHGADSPYSPYFMIPVLKAPRRDSVFCHQPQPQLMDLTDSYAAVRWNNDTLGHNFEIAFGTDTTDPENNIILTATNNLRFFTGLTPNTTYAVWARRECVHKCYCHDTILWSDWSQPLIFTTSFPDTTAILSPNLDALLTLYPNPTNGELRVESSEWNIETIEIYDINGRQVHRQNLKTSESLTLNLKHLPAGTYLLQATGAGQTSRQTFIKK